MTLPPPFLRAALCLSLLAACAPQPDAPPAIDRTGDRVVATVDGRPIHASDVLRAASAEGLIAQGEGLLPDSPVFARTLDGLIDQRLLSDRAAATGLDRDPEALRRLDAARERILGNLLVERGLEEAVTDDALRDLFEAQNRLAASGPERRIRQIVVATENDAQAVVAALDDGEDFAELARTRSTDRTSANAGGDLGWTTRGALPAELRGPVFALADGARTQALKTAAGWVVVEVTDRRSPGASASFEDVRDDLARFMTFQEVEAMMRKLRGDADIRRGEDLPAQTTNEDSP